jgi:transposase
MNEPQEAVEGFRWKIVHTWKALGSIRATAIELGIYPNTVKKWVDRYKATGDVKAMKQSGRPRLLDDEMGVTAHKLLLSEEHGHADGVATALVNQGIMSKKVSGRTVIRAAKRVGIALGQPLKLVRGRPKKSLSDNTKRARLAFAKANRSRSWATVMFTDRKKFQFFYPGAKVKHCRWMVKGQRLSAASVNHAQCVNVYCGLTRHGMTEIHVVAGSSNHKTEYKNKKGSPARNITTAEYKDVMKSTLLPQGTKIFSTRGISSWTMQQDNDPTHRSAKETISEWNASHSSSISLLQNWPPNSPDLSPIENVWAYVDAKINAMGCKTLAEYKQAIVDHLQNLPKTFITNLFNSLPKRMAQVIELGGDKTKY